MTDGNGLRHDQAIETLLSDEGFQSFQLSAGLRALVETGAEGLEAARCSVWQFSLQPRCLSCISLYDEASGGHVSGPVLQESEHPELFFRLSQPQSQIYVAGDEDVPPELSQFMSHHGFSAMMQWPVVVQGQLTAVLAFADRAPHRRWSDEDQSFARLLAALVALAFRGDELRRQAFPCAAAASPLPNALHLNGVQEKKAAAGTGGAGSTILLVDADTAVHDLLGEALSRRAYHLIHAFDHLQGFDLAAEIQPDVIVVNVLSPGLDGWGLLGRLKTHEDLRNIPVVVVTLSGEEDEGYLLRASDFLTKPFRFEALLEAVNRHRPANGQPCLLVIEDEDVTRSVLSRLLERDGWTVACAANGFDGLKALEEVRPDLVLLDLMMPGMDGFEFIRMLRTTEQPGKHLPLVVVTAKDLSEEERSWLTGTTRSLAERDAVSRAELVDTIRDWVGHATARRTVVC